MRFKLGDMVINHCASDNNPTKVFIVTSHIGKKVSGFTRSGGSILFDGNDMLEKIGELDFYSWDDSLGDLQGREQ